MNEQNSTQEHQKDIVKQELFKISEQIVYILAQKIVNLHQSAMDKGIAAELVSTVIDEFKKENFPEFVLEVRVDSLPPKELRN